MARPIAPAAVSADQALAARPTIRQAQALDLFWQGYHYRQIGDALGSTPQAAWSLVRAALAEATGQRMTDLDRIRTMLDGRYEALWLAAEPGIITGNLDDRIEARKLLG